MNCEPCTLREAGHVDRAEAIESIRSQRLVLARLNGAEDAVGEISAELRGCHDCIGRLAATYLGMSTASLIRLAGNADEAVRWVERGLLEDIDGLGG